MKHLLYCGLFLLAATACKEDKKTTGDDGDFFPVHSFLQSQIAHIDTSLYQITRIVKTKGRADTSYLRREEFRTAAQDFLNVPDIAAESLRNRYTETKLFDELLKRAVFTYTPKNRLEPIQREDVTIEPGTNGDQVKTIFIDQLLSEGSRTVQKKMLWQVGRRFQVVTSISSGTDSTETSTTEVRWE